MGLIAKEGGGGGLPQVSEGVHRAVCYSIYDLGTHRDTRYDKDKHQVLFIWEIPDERIEVEKDGQKQMLPRVISKKYTLSLGERAILRKDLQTWRGRSFTKEELQEFDLNNVLGVQCQLQIIHEQSKSHPDRKYANVIAIIPMPKGSPKITPENPMRFYSMTDDGPNIPEGTPPWIVEEIHKSDEWAAMTGGPPDTEEKAPWSPEDDVPF